MYIDLHVNFPLLWQILTRLEISRNIFKIKVPNFIKIPVVGDKILRADGHTSMTVLTGTLWNFTNGPKMSGTVHPLTITKLFIDRHSTEFTFHTLYERLFFVFLYVDISVVYVRT